MAREIMAAFDLLPRDVRDAINYSPFPHNPLSLLHRMRNGATSEQIVSQIAEQDSRGLRGMGSAALEGAQS